MNDFTKEELEYLCQFLNIAIEDFQEPDKTYDLRDKIQLMIDNYCEHEYENDFGKDSRPRFEKAKNPKCKHCGEFYR